MLSINGSDRIGCVGSPELIEWETGLIWCHLGLDRSSDPLEEQIDQSLRIGPGAPLLEVEVELELHPKYGREDRTSLRNSGRARRCGRVPAVPHARFVCSVMLFIPA